MKSRNYNGGTLYGPHNEPTRYQLEDTLGIGSSGTVYRSHLPNTPDTPLAVKVCNFGDEDEGTSEHAAFKSEASLSQELRHDNLVPTYKHWLGAIAVPVSDVLDWRQVMTMEYADGGSLRDQLRNRGRFPVSKVVTTVEQTARGLNYMHAQGVIHGDVKPDNLLQFGETVKLGDLGAAKNVTELQSSWSAIGSPAYMAPEQFNGQPSSASSDLYSTAVTTYELITGTRPFSFSDIQEYIGSPKWPTPSLTTDNGATSNRQLDAIAPVIIQSIASDPGERHASVMAFSADLRQSYEKGTARAKKCPVVLDLAPHPITPIDAPHPIEVATQFYRV